MIRTQIYSPCRRGRQHGAALIEFSLSILIFFVVVMGVIEFGRALFLINMAGKATQMATRLATVCDQNDPQYEIIRNKVKYFIQSSGQIRVPAGSSWLNITPNSDTCYFLPKSGNVDPCWITTSLSSLSFKLMIPLVDIRITLPEYRVTQVREAMTSTNNPACSP